MAARLLSRRPRRRAPKRAGPAAEVRADGDEPGAAPEREVLAVCAGGGTGYDIGSLAVASARSWAAGGREVLLVDADASGSGLAKRLSKATHKAFSPSERGMPSLIAARRGIEADSLREHCWTLEVGGGSLWALFAPTHPSGARRSARWLADHAGELAALRAHRWVVVSLPGLPDEIHVELLERASVTAIASQVSDASQLMALRQAADKYAAGGWQRSNARLIIEGQAGISDAIIDAETGIAVVGRLGQVRDSALLGGRARLGDRRVLAAIDKIAAGLTEPPAETVLSSPRLGRPPAPPSRSLRRKKRGHDAA
ncbi:hypothetical protein [Candidatus Poriferisodalis sp.]|uniref:hypothetical protein n=1 Tax=Candidatus Poriferisodalis sp. TaxID=3101277 RepID=UPI003AF4ECD8